MVECFISSKDVWSLNEAINDVTKSPEKTPVFSGSYS